MCYRKSNGAEGWSILGARAALRLSNAPVQIHLPQIHLQKRQQNCRNTGVIFCCIIWSNLVMKSSVLSLADLNITALRWMIEWSPANSHRDVKFEEKYLSWHHTTWAWMYYVTGLQRLYARYFSFSAWLWIEMNDNCHFAIAIYKH